MEYQEIMARLDRVVSEPPRPIPEAGLARIRDEYFARNKRSLEIFEQAKEVIPGGVEHNLSSNDPFPLAMDHGEGAYIWDVDRNRYVDYLLCGAPIILGHRFKPLQDEIIRIIEEKGPSTGLTSEYEILAAREIIRHMPGVEMVRFFQSGTEAVMAVVRAARAFTKKKKIVKIGGSYHGWSDQMVLSLHLPGTGALYAAGIPGECFADMVELAPNDFSGLEKIFADHRDRGGVAAVIVEPVGGESGSHPVHPDWNKAIREICDANEALLIFDEVVTGFRLDLGGAQKYFGVKPDLTVLGKIITHGFPSSGAIGGRKDVLAVCHAKLGEKIYVGGTLAANPISAGACYHALRLMEEHDAVGKATAYADLLVRELNGLFGSRPDLPFFAYNYGPIIQYVTTGFFHISLNRPDAFEQIFTRKKVADDYQMATTVLGLCTLAGTRMYTCMQHDRATLDLTLAAWDRVLALIPKA
ncbi:MAG: aminotransferase class III-fold pyridoxal phosphate-dependent enzyme [Pseudomonadota bacterium]